MRQHRRIAFNRDDLYREFRLLGQHPAHQSRGEHPRTSARVQYAKCAARRKERKRRDQLRRRSGGEELSQVALRACVESAEGGDSLDLGDAQEVCRQHPLIVSGTTDSDRGARRGLLVDYSHRRIPPGHALQVSLVPVHRSRSGRVALVRRGALRECFVEDFDVVVEIPELWLVGTGRFRMLVADVGADAGAGLVSEMVECVCRSLAWVYGRRRVVGDRDGRSGAVPAVPCGVVGLVIRVGFRGYGAGRGLLDHSARRSGYRWASAGVFVGRAVLCGASCLCRGR